MGIDSSAVEGQVRLMDGAVTDTHINSAAAIQRSKLQHQRAARRVARRRDILQRDVLRAGYVLFLELRPVADVKQHQVRIIFRLMEMSGKPSGGNQ